MRRNYRQIEDMIRLGADLGADSLVFSDIQYSFNIGISKRDESLRLSPVTEKKEIQRLFKKATLVKKKLDYDITKMRCQCQEICLYSNKNLKNYQN